MDQQSQLMAARDSYRRRLILAAIPAQHVARLAQLREEFFAQLARSPERFEQYLRYNFKKRARRETSNAKTSE